MENRENKWVIPLISGMFLLVISITLLESAAWFVQYGALGIASALAIFSVYQAVLEMPSE